MTYKLYGLCGNYLKESFAFPVFHTGIIIDSMGNKFWRLNGKLHRKEGPAVERANNAVEWFLNGELHRIGGPAIYWKDGYANSFYYINGKEVTKDQHDLLYSIMKTKGLL